jgi:hypothetical protein
VLIASMDVTPEAESLFNEVYDTEHVPNLTQAPGVRCATRMKGRAEFMCLAGPDIRDPFKVRLRIIIVARKANMNMNVEPHPAMPPVDALPKRLVELEENPQL